MGVFAGLTSFLTAMIFLYGPLTDLDPYYYSVLILAFFLSSFIGYYVYRKISVSNQKYTVAMEKIQEDINLITNHLKRRRDEALAMEEKKRGLFSVKNIAERLSLALSREEIVKIVSEETFRLFGKDNRVMLFMPADALNGLELVSSSKNRRRKQFMALKGGVFEKWSLENMKSLLVKNIRNDFRFSVSEDELKDDAVSLMIKPLVAGSRVLGMFRIDSSEESMFVQHDLRILDIIGDLAAVALRNARLYRRTEELAVKDSLTGLYVYRHFMERLGEETKRALLSKNPFALLMIDIDDFKKFNDKYGHISGDTILRNIGRILRDKSSAGDVAARYGGEEFAFLVLGANRKKAVKLADDIRDEIHNNPVVLRRGKRFVTVSIGVAVFPDDADLREDLIWEADKHLYNAKREGKNIVCSK
ncbi:MAG: sensor domain-containing diguanylate cyclase [Candidatus Omnitrophota bacterium]